MQSRLRHSSNLGGMLGASSGGGSPWPASAPTGLTATVISDTRIDLAWTNVDTTGDGVSIEQSTDGVTFAEITTVALGVAVYSNTGLTQSTKYYYRVRAYKGSNYSSYSGYATSITWATAISDGNTVAWYKADDLTTITKDANNLVSRWNDKLGSGRDLIQTTSDAKKPKWGINGILFDGQANGMRATFAWVKPEYVYLVLRQLTWVSNEFIMDGNANLSLLLRQAPGGVTPEIGAYAGTASTSDANLKTQNIGIVRVLFNGANSKLQVNENAAITGNFGAADAGGLTFGSNILVTGSFGHCEILEAVCRRTADSGATESSIYAYLKAKYQGVWVKQGVVLTASLAGEVSNVYEPCIIREGNPQILTGTVFKMWYSGGWGNGNVYYAESTDGVSWTKYGGGADSPLVTSHVRTYVVKNGSTYYLFATGEDTEAHIDLYSSNNGVNFNLVSANVIVKGASGAWDDTYVGNCCVWIEDGTWYMLYDGTGGDASWHTGLATSADGITWTKYASNPVINEGTTRGGCTIQKIGSTYWIWVIGAPIIGAGTALPSDVYRYRSTDLHTWVADPTWPVIARNTVDEGQNTVKGQLADPFIIEYNNQCYLYYAGSADGSAAAGHQQIKLAIADMPLARLIETKEGNIIP